jgi:hypothetical protein
VRAQSTTRINRARSPLSETLEVLGSGDRAELEVLGRVDAGELGRGGARAELEDEGSQE